MNEDAMAKVEHVQGERRIVETPTEARQAEPGPSILALLTVSTIAAISQGEIVSQRRIDLNRVSNMLAVSV